jgi:hypothetical protein
MSKYKLSDIDKIIVRNPSGSITNNLPLPTRSFTKGENGEEVEHNPIQSPQQYMGWATHNVLIGEEKKVPTDYYVEAYIKGELVIKVQWKQREDNPNKRRIEVIEDKVFG